MVTPVPGIVVFALVHFTVGFVIGLTALSVIPVTRYRLTGGYVGGLWALGPDLHHFIDGALGEQLRTLHNSPRADLFFFHHTLDANVFRAHNFEFTFVSLAVLGIAFVGYDWRFGVARPAAQPDEPPEVADETPRD